jgi:hypothetical protein
MIGKRIFQLLIHLLVLGFCLYTLPDFFNYHVDWWDIFLATVTFIVALLLAASIKLNWNLLKNQRWEVQLPPTSWIQFVLVGFSPAVIYFTTRLRFAYDGHLSEYDLYANLPDWLWLPKQVERLQLGIAGTDLGVYFFIICIFAFMVLVAMHAFGWLSGTKNSMYSSLSPTLIYAHMLGCSLLFPLPAIMLYHFCFYLARFFDEASRYNDLLNTANLGRLFFGGVSIMLLLSYSLWAVFDSIHLWRMSRVVRVSS